MEFVFELVFGLIELAIKAIYHIGVVFAIWLAASIFIWHPSAELSSLESSIGWSILSALYFAMMHNGGYYKKKSKRDSAPFFGVIILSLAVIFGWFDSEDLYFRYTATALFALSIPATWLGVRHARRLEREAQAESSPSEKLSLSKS